MAFWSGETLKVRLRQLVDPADNACIDSASYMLKVGAEYYVTPTDRTRDPQAVTVKTLGQGEAFAIPPGQFAYILTEEVVTVPSNALALISIRARVKFRGLINVSGFHVDPGFSNRLTFAVFNAGPVTVHLRRGDPTFLIWFADLDKDAKEYAKKPTVPSAHLDMSVISQVAGEVYSVQGLADRIKGTEKELDKRITALERANGAIYVVATVILTIFGALVVQWVVHTWAPKNAVGNTIANSPGNSVILETGSASVGGAAAASDPPPAPATTPQ